MCRAFRKPDPNQRMGFEAWNHAYYVRDCSGVGVNPATSSMSNNTTDNLCHSDLAIHWQVGVENEISQNCSKFSEDHQQMELPRLANEDCEEQRSSRGTSSHHQYSNLKSPDDNIAASTSDFASRDDFTLDLEDKNHIGYFLGFFRDS